MRTPKKKIIVEVAFIVVALGAYYAVAYRLSVLIWLGVAFLATIAMLWIFAVKLRRALKTVAFQFLFAGKIIALLLCGSGFYLTLWPLPEWTTIISNIWFASLALWLILSDIGHYLYGRDLAVSERELREVLRRMEMEKKKMDPNKPKDEVEEIDDEQSSSEPTADDGSGGGVGQGPGKKPGDTTTGDESTSGTDGS